MSLACAGAGEALNLETVQIISLGRLMTAHIQPRNVPFFEHLGWRVFGDQEIYVGVPHIPMAIDLGVRAP